MSRDEASDMMKSYSWVVALVAAFVGPAVGYGLLQGQVEANARQIAEMSDVRERLAAIETSQKYTEDTLKRILHAVDQ